MTFEISAHDVPEHWSPTDWRVVEDHWEDGEEWMVIEIVNPVILTQALLQGWQPRK
jgi:hypothetical protein